VLGLSFFGVAFGTVDAASKAEIIEAAKKEAEVVVWSNDFDKPEEFFKQFRDLLYPS
jgi:hypothetical protein